MAANIRVGNYNWDAQLFSAEFGDANFSAALVSSNPRITFDTGDYIEYDRANNILRAPGVEWSAAASGSYTFRRPASGISQTTAWEYDTTSDDVNFRYFRTTNTSGNVAYSMFEGKNTTNLLFQVRRDSDALGNGVSYSMPGKVYYTPSSAQTINAAGNKILANATTVRITNTTGGAITLTSTPTIADGTNGQIVIIRNVGTQNVVLQDQGTLAGSNLRLTAASITLAPRNSVWLQYDSGVGDWVQISNVVAVL